MAGAARAGKLSKAEIRRIIFAAHMLGAVCPARGVGAALVLPTVNIEAMNMHLAEISRSVTTEAIALLVVDGAG